MNKGSETRVRPGMETHEFCWGLVRRQNREPDMMKARLDISFEALSI